MKYSWNLLPLCLVVAFASNTRGAVEATIVESDGDVVVSANGSLNLSALRFDSANAHLWSEYAGSFPSLIVGKPFTERVNAGTPAEQFYIIIDYDRDQPMSIGDRAASINADEGTGDTFGVGALYASRSGIPGDEFYVTSWIVVPGRYESGEQLAGTATYRNQTFSSLGVTPGTYTWSWGEEEEFDSFTLYVVPEPSSAALLIALAIACSLGRRMQVA